GARIAELGDASVNGGWPPHLHFQVVRDLFGHVGDFPGVCGPSERAAWTANSPDPAPLLGLEDWGAHEPSLEDVHARRREAFCSSMSISYDVPLHIVKGRGTTLFDAGGRPFLDAVNNVAHVGHCHPRVVAAAQRQTALLGTNTRYLSESRLAYVDALRARLPEHLEVVYLVSSGSEANELALRLARAATGRRDVLVQEHGYHGHSSALVELSHYKFARKGGFERRAWVDVVPIADPYRGAHRGPDSGPDYAREVEARLVQMEAEGRPAAALFAEAIVGCGGQVVPPDGYLAAAFEAARSAGAVAVADEVQVGFGRVGTHFWAFEEQGAVPDIVTMGKPMGNGHPIAGVATTRAIADAFAGGMEFFATFGGNDVSCAIGHAVLDVIEDEGLVANAAARGAQFFEALSPLAKELELIGDVRGRGLYLGVDLVADAETLAPDGAAAHWTANRMRELGILISTDGPAENVLKIKPPIVFSEAEMERLVCTLGGVLREAQSLRVQIRCQDHQQ
ncbi:MAG: aminotransferase class III-fold pyridoxal phosphate-dependent enzyme, partial [Planctomycetota bacterium]